MGYELERFVDKVPNAFICLICHEVVRNPKECSICESLYCSECLAQCLEQTNSLCPNRCEKSEMMRPGRVIRSSLEDLLLRCKYAKNGCGKVDRLGRIDLHESDECPFNCDIKKCSSPICQNKDAVENMLQHVSPDHGGEPVYVCSLKCAATLECQMILTTSRSQDEMLRRLQTLFVSNLSSVLAVSASSNGTQDQTEQSPIFCSPMKVKKEPVELPDGSVYHGEWTSDGRMEGSGIQTWADGARYEGEFIAGEKHGFGIKTTSNGQSYAGFWRHNNRCGHGTYTWPSGSCYTGNFKHGDNHGWGKYTWHNGKIYEGEYKNDEKDGFGAMIFPDGRRYVGEWKHNMHHGKGILTNLDQSEYYGEFVDDMKHGSGVLKYSDGSKHIGYFEMDKLNGVVCFVTKEGKKETQLLLKRKKRKSVVPQHPTRSANQTIEADSLISLPSPKSAQGLLIPTFKVVTIPPVPEDVQALSSSARERWLIRHTPVTSSKFLDVWKRVRAKLQLRGRLGGLQKDVQLFGSKANGDEDAGDILAAQIETAAQRGLQQEEEEIELLPWYLLHPRSHFRSLWNLLVIALLIYTATVMPFRLAFDDTDESVTWKVAEWVLDGLFFTDVVITCFSAYYDDEGKLIVTHKAVVLNYLRTWMLLDIAGCLPLDVMMQSSTRYNTLIRLTRLPRLYRLTRIGRLLRMWRSSRGAECLEAVRDFLSIKHTATRLLSFFCSIFVCVHIMACLWVFIAKIEDSPDSWLVHRGFQDGSIRNQYIASVYWAFTSISTVGYGDITPNTSLERCLSIFWMVCGVYFFSFTIGSLSSILSNIDTKETVLITKLAIIDEFVRDAHLTKGMRNLLRTSIKYNSDKTGYSLADKQDLFYELPRNLRYDVALSMHQGAIRDIPFFTEKDHAFVAMIVPFLRHLFVQSLHMVYRVDDYADEVYFISKGWCGVVYGAENYLVKKLQRGSYFGDIEVIQGSTRKFAIMAATDTDLLVMNKKLLATVQQEFPGIYQDMVDVASMRDKLNEKTITEHKELLRMKKDQHLDEMKISEIKKSVALRAIKKLEKKVNFPSKDVSERSIPENSLDLQRQVAENEYRMNGIDRKLEEILSLVSEQRTMVQALLRGRGVEKRGRL